MVPYQGLHGRWCWFLHRCVCDRVTHSDISLTAIIAMTSSLSISPPPCWAMSTVQVSFYHPLFLSFVRSPPNQVESSPPTRISVSKSLPPSVPWSDNSSSVGSLMLSVVKRCVSIVTIHLAFYPFCSLTIHHRRCRAHDYYCCHLRSGPLWSSPCHPHYRCTSRLAFHCEWYSTSTPVQEFVLNNRPDGCRNRW